MSPQVPDEMAIDRRQLVMTIAHAVDLVGVDDVLHGRRVGMLARELALQLGCAPATCIMLYDAGLLHDCGVSSTRHHRRLVVDLEWAGAQEHCQRGDALLREFRPLAHLAPIIRAHHTRWDAMAGAGVPAEIALLANLIYLADRIDVLAAPFHADHSLLEHVQEIRQRLAAERGRMFAPELIDAFLVRSAGEAFWLALDPEWVGQYQGDMEARGEVVTIGWGEFRQCAEILARIIDAKSPYTERHSRGVASLARHIAGRMGFSPVACEKIEVAGLLHDIGKLQIPDEIIEGTAALNEHEFDLMKSHSYATLQVLHRLGAIREIALWAAHHHETPDGHGYPFRLGGGNLSLEARIINVADIFQALAQDRPYRGGMAPDAILAILQDRAAGGRADAGVVAVIAADLDPCYRAALAVT